MKVLLLGAGAAGLLGAIAGDLSQPVLSLGQAPMTEAAAWRELAPVDGGMTVHDGPVPDHVIGTDWLRPPELHYVMETPVAAEAAPADEAPAVQPVETDAHAYAAWEPPPVESYPSVNGDILGGVGPQAETPVAAPPEPPPA